MASNRKRNFATVVYAESAPDNWQGILADCLVPSFVSPLHDADLTADGEPKKPHWHVMIMFEGIKSPEQAVELFDRFGGVGCEVINSMKAYARYLCHLDSPDKARYSPDEVVSLGGAVYSEVIAVASDRYQLLGEMIDFCVSNSMLNYADLLEWARVSRSDWFRVLCDGGTFIIKEYMKSRCWKQSETEREVTSEDV